MTNAEFFKKVFGLEVNPESDVCMILSCKACGRRGNACEYAFEDFWNQEADYEEANYEPVVELQGDIANKFYLSGLKDAWNIAKKLALNSPEGGADANELENAFGNPDWYDIIENEKIEDLVKKYADYADRKKIEVGDIVRHSSLVSDTEFLVLRVFDGGQSMTCITRYGTLYDDELTKEYIGTGKRCEDFLNFRKGEDND